MRLFLSCPMDLGLQLSCTQNMFETIYALCIFKKYLYLGFGPGHFPSNYSEENVFSKPGTLILSFNF